MGTRLGRRLRHILLPLLILALVCNLGFAFPAGAHDGPTTMLGSFPIEKPGNTKLDSQLNQLVTDSETDAPETQKGGFALVDDGIRVIVECYPDQMADATQTVSGLGILVEASYSNYLQLLCPLSKLTGLSEIPGVRFIRVPEPLQLQIQSEGVPLINADDWQTTGFTGNGVKVGIIDVGFSGYTIRQSQGELPATLHTWWAPSIGSEGSNVHGTACAEIVYDVAPGAEFFLANISTIVEFGNAVAWMISQDVDVISFSAGWALGGPGDGTGPICDIIASASASGITWAQAMGNYAQQHWQGMFTDNDEDGWHEFTATYEVNGIYANVGETIQVGLKWNDTWGAAGNDYDIGLFNSDLSSLLVVSANEQNGDDDPVEYFEYTAFYSGYYYLAINQYSSTKRVSFNLYSFLSPLQHAVAASSFIIPADSPHVIAVGAIAYGSYNLAAIEPFSSQGPTKNGHTIPALVAPDAVRTSSYGSAPFYGTSAATPHVAGAAVLVKQRYPDKTPSQIQSFLEYRANDLGTSVKDNIYGSGRLDLGTPQDVVYQLTIGKVGNGFVSPVPGTYQYPANTVVTLSATPGIGYRFSEWTGGVNNPSVPVTGVTMDSDKTIMAVFVEAPDVTLVISVSGNGTTSPAAGTYQYSLNSVVNVTANANAGWRFSGWTGGVANPSLQSTTVTMNGDKTIAAVFVEAPDVTLVISVTGNGVTDPAPGAYQYPFNTVVALNANANAGWRFTDWTGGVANRYSQITTITMNDDKNISANFIESSTSSEKIAFYSMRDGNGEIYIMDTDGSDQINLSHNAASDSGPAFSPDGTHIAFESWRNGNSDIYVMDINGANQVRLTDSASLDHSPAWSPDSLRIAFCSNRDGNDEIYIMNADGTNQVRLTNNTAPDGAPSWSPDGSKIAFDSMIGGEYEICVISAGGGAVTRLTYNDTRDLAPAWSPDGSKIAFTALRDGQSEIYVMNTNGGAQIRLTSNPSGGADASWSPDGTKIAFWDIRDAQYDIWVMNADGTNQVRLTSNSAQDREPSWGPVKQGTASVTTDEATEIGFSGAVLNGYLDDIGTNDSVDVCFEWGITSEYGNSTPTVTLNAPGTFSYALSLTPNTTYHYRAKVISDGVNYGADMTFATLSEYTLMVNVVGAGDVTQVPGWYMELPVIWLTAIPEANWHFDSWTGNVADPSAAQTYIVMDADKEVTANFVVNPPEAQTGNASVATSTSAMLNGTVTLGPLSGMTVSFQWGTTPGEYAYETTDEYITASGPVSAPISGLTEGTTYYYRIKADCGEYGVIYGDEKMFVAGVGGDANGDGNINALDITKVERVIAGLDGATSGADANRDGNVNALDITRIERIIAGLG